MEAEEEEDEEEEEDNEEEDEEEVEEEAIRASSYASHRSKLAKIGWTKCVVDNFFKGGV